ncbi:MAG: ATP-binding cassette domain-containing protein [Acidimicrobiia bacterium]
MNDTANGNFELPGKPADITDPVISLEGLSMRYPGTTVPAVDDLTLNFARGEITVLVGPSGCGKSTTLRLINRIIEPTGGRIIFDGEDVTSVNPDQLRRNIGYVIQKVGLFPHRTIGENVATVPRLLGWKKPDINARVDELLDLVGLDPTIYRDRYPKELSGGQAQRVGVARALGADPPVMLMDEPFGAIDPITRDRLQNEFLRLQSELHKSIIFVTHDIDEAIKMGDRIVILKERSQIAQYDTPQRILAHPIDDFVDDFLGSGSTLKGLNFERVRDVTLAHYPTMGPDTSIEDALIAIDASPEKWLVLVDQNDRPVRWLQRRDLLRANTPADLPSLGRPVRATVEPQATLRDALEEMIQSSHGTLLVVDGRGRYQGCLDIETITGVIHRMQAEAREFYQNLTGEVPVVK